MKKFRFLEHAADVKALLQGNTLEELFVNGALAVLCLAGIPGKREDGRVVKRVKIEAETIEDLLVAWLNEIIWLFYGKKFIPGIFSLHVNERNPSRRELKAELKGVPFNPGVDIIQSEIKAATYHRVNIIKNGGIFSAEVVFDV